MLYTAGALISRNPVSAPPFSWGTCWSFHPPLRSVHCVRQGWRCSPPQGVTELPSQPGQPHRPFLPSAVSAGWPLPCCFQGGSGGLRGTALYTMCAIKTAYLFFAGICVKQCGWLALSHRFALRSFVNLVHSLEFGYLIDIVISPGHERKQTWQDRIGS